MQEVPEMIHRMSWRIAAALAIAAVPGTTVAGRAQDATTGMLGGVVRDAQLGVLPGASVVAVHAPTGTRSRRSPVPTGGSTC